MYGPMRNGHGGTSGQNQFVLRNLIFHIVVEIRQPSIPLPFLNFVANQEHNDDG